MTRRYELELELATTKAELASTAALLDTERTTADGWRDTANGLERRLEDLILETERGWRGHVRERIVVNTVDRAGFRGILWDATGPLLVLRDVELLGEAGVALASPQRLDGEVIIERARVAWVQVPPTAPTE